MKTSSITGLIFAVLLFAGVSSAQHVKAFDGRDYTTLAPSASGTSGFVADTGVVTLGPNQFVRIIATVPLRSLVRSLTVTFNTQMNTHGTCNASGVCVHTLSSLTTSQPVVMVPGQAASIDVRPTPNASGVRGEMLMVMDMSPSTRPDIDVNFEIVDGNTGNVVASNKLFVGGLSWDTLN